MFFLVVLEHEQLDSYINEMVIQNGDELGKRPTFYCGICHQQGNSKQDLERHVESTFKPIHFTVQLAELHIKPEDLCKDIK